MDETAGQQNVDRLPSTIDSLIDPTGQRFKTLELANLVIPRSPGVEESAPVLGDAAAPPPSGIADGAPRQGRRGRVEEAVARRHAASVGSPLRA